MMMNMMATIRSNNDNNDDKSKIIIVIITIMITIIEQLEDLVSNLSDRIRPPLRKSMLIEWLDSSDGCLEGCRRSWGSLDFQKDRVTLGGIVQEAGSMGLSDCKPDHNFRGERATSKSQDQNVSSMVAHRNPDSHNAVFCVDHWSTPELALCHF